MTRKPSGEARPNINCNVPRPSARINISPAQHRSTSRRRGLAGETGLVDVPSVVVLFTLGIEAEQPKRDSSPSVWSTGTPRGNRSNHSDCAVRASPGGLSSVGGSLSGDGGGDAVHGGGVGTEQSRNADPPQLDSAFHGLLSPNGWLVFTWNQTGSDDGDHFDVRNLKNGLGLQIIGCTI